MEDVITAESPDILIFGHSYEARDWVPRLSARLDIPFISDCIGFKNDGEFTLVRSVYQGKFNADICVNSEKYIVSFQSGVCKIDAIKSGSASIRNMSVELANVGDSIQPGKKFQESETSVDLTQADIIVSVGRGIGKEENLELVYELSNALSAEVASSRPVVDSGWLEPYHQVGSSGQTVSPKLYLALGISGAIQHVVGMKGSKNIVVINKDANAPIFEIADYGVVGDLFEIVPKLITAIQNS
jgi:electron transfer flavoprotein alpha subunit